MWKRRSRDIIGMGRCVKHVNDADEAIWEGGVFKDFL